MLVAPEGLPRIEAGDDLAEIFLAALAGEGLALADGDIVAVAQKLVSKAEGRLVRLADVCPGPAALELAAESGKDPRLAELILSESSEVMRVRTGFIIVRHRLGLVLANAGIDQSNIDHEGAESALLLPVDPDASAAALGKALRARTGAEVGVVIIDSIGRAWRNGAIGTAIGVAGMPALLDLRGVHDLFGRPLATSELGLADEVAAAASILMEQAAEGRPMVLLRGLAMSAGAGRASDLVRNRAMDLFP
ncbi:coenzyme F420-0:L-glutamate ligase [Novosphingobium sp. BL-52-GroH]|uniref:coenzyme F420-0:L-glutamate ligase n=1 Tax=Novosphingobium sp. BL-52-GroH TaxID=3349877 RepID=UPI003850ACDE